MSERILDWQAGNVCRVLNDISVSDTVIFKSIRKKTAVKQKILFCQRNVFCYIISEAKKIVKRHIKNLVSGIDFAKTKSTEQLPVVLWRYESGLIKTGKGVDPKLKQNKAVNINVASKKIDSSLIKPGQVFSFWKTVGNTTILRGF